MRTAIALAIIALFLLSACTTGTVIADVIGIEQEAEEEANTDCVDSDGGINKAKKGRVSGYDAEGVFIKDEADRCLPPFLIEYYCEDGIVKSKNIRCQVCDRGLCPMVVRT